MFDYSPEALNRVPVGDCMHHSIYTCDPDAPLAEVTAIMADRGTHSIVVPFDGGYGIISDVDVLAAIGKALEPTARELAATELLTLPSDATLREAAERMADHAVSHVVVIERSTGRPAGIISSTDIIRACAPAAGFGRPPAGSAPPGGG